MKTDRWARALAISSVLASLASIVVKFTVDVYFLRGAFASFAGERALDALAVWFRCLWVVSAILAAIGLATGVNLVFLPRSSPVSRVMSLILAAAAVLYLFVMV